MQLYYTFILLCHYEALYVCYLARYLLMLPWLKFFCCTVLIFVLQDRSDMKYFHFVLKTIWYINSSAAMAISHRNGQAISFSVLRSVSNMLTELGIYTVCLETSLLYNTAQFYQTDGDQSAASMKVRWSCVLSLRERGRYNSRYLKKKICLSSCFIFLMCC